MPPALLTEEGAAPGVGMPVGAERQEADPPLEPSGGRGPANTSPKAQGDPHGLPSTERIAVLFQTIKFVVTCNSCNGETKTPLLKRGSERAGGLFGWHSRAGPQTLCAFLGLPSGVWEDQAAAPRKAPSGQSECVLGLPWELGYGRGAQAPARTSSQRLWVGPRGHIS